VIYIETCPTAEGDNPAHSGASVSASLAVSAVTTPALGTVGGVMEDPRDGSASTLGFRV